MSENQMRVTSMKMVVAVIQPFKLDAVTRELGQIDRFPGMTVCPARGFGIERLELLLPDAIDDFVEQVQLWTVVPEDLAEQVLNTIVDAAHTGRYGDGIVVILPVERRARIGAAVPESDG